MILVTGGTGLVGSHLLVQLAKKGLPVRALYRDPKSKETVLKIFSYYHENASDLFKKISWHQADINDIPALESAFEGVTKVYHAAAYISFDPNDYERLLKVNAEGTANIVNLCLLFSIEKLCYVSSIATLGSSVSGAMTNEEDEFTEQHANVYARSKYLAELEVWRGAQEGLTVVTVNPGIIIGPGFWKGGSGNLFTTADRGSRFYPPGGTGFVTVNDVVRLMLKLMESPVRNERYLAVSENLTYKKMLELFAESLNKPMPKTVLRFWQLDLLRWMDWLWSLVSGNARKLTKNGIRSLRQQERYDTQKSKTELDFDFESVAPTIAFSCQKFIEERS